MEWKSSRKRHFFEDEDSDKQPMQKRVRFPKGKKVKPGNVKDDDGVGPTDLKNPHLAAMERASRRSQMTFELCSEESRGVVNDISAAEVTYKVTRALRSLKGTSNKKEKMSAAIKAYSTS